MLDMFNYGVTEQHKEVTTDLGRVNGDKTAAIKRLMAAREFLHKQGLGFAVATGVCAAAVQSDALGYATVAMACGGWLFNAWLTKRLYNLGLRQVAVRVQFMCAVPEDEE